MQDRKILLIYNPHSGKGAMKSEIGNIVDVLTENGDIVTLFPTRYRNHAKELVELHAKQYDLVICCGGDGTLNETINGLMTLTKPVPLGYIPSGTVNDFATNFELGKTMVDAAKTAISGEPFAFDVGSLNDRAFCYFAGFGLFTDVSHQTPQEYKNLLGRVAYFLEGAKRLTNIKSYKLEVSTEKDVINGEFIFGMITNSESVGGFKTMYGKTAKLDDGLFELLLAYKPKTPSDIQALLQCILTQTHNPRYIYRAQISEVSITSVQEVDWTLDGEHGGVYENVAIKNHKQTLEIMINKT